jgi:hypothetical protein
MTREEAIAALKKIAKIKDGEFRHIEADEVLGSLLISLGYSDVVVAYEDIEKWYD